MIKPENMHSDHFEIKAKDAPITMWTIYDLQMVEELVTIGFDADHDGQLMITGAWQGDEELGLSFSDHKALIAMKEVYDDNQRQERAEEGA